MRKTILGLAVLTAVTAVLWGQRERVPDRVTERVTDVTPYEVRSVFPREFSPGQFQQVTPIELDQLAAQGWELVSVTPYVYRNEEHGQQLQARAVVTQTYPAYFFKRVRPAGRR